MVVDCHQIPPRFQQLLSMMRVGILEGGVESSDRTHTPPGQRLYIAQATQSSEQKPISYK